MENLKKIFSNYIENANMSIYTSFKLGGKAKILCFPLSIEELKYIVNYCKENNIKYFILGKGTNTIFKDGVFNGVIINLEKLCKEIEIEKGMIKVGSGVSLLYFNIWCRQNELSGLEWSYGIPGSVGGAVYMNAGAYLGEMANHIVKVQVLEKGKIKTLPKNKIIFDYRFSSFQKNDMIILNVWLKLNKAKFEEIKEKQIEYLQKRQISQPLEFPNAGSVFKRDGDIIPAKLIDNLGLKGVKIGNIQVSTKHSGFIVNLGDGTASELIELISYIKKVVLEKEKIVLKEEIIIIGED